MYILGAPDPLGTLGLAGRPSAAGSEEPVRATHDESSKQTLSFTELRTLRLCACTSEKNKTGEGEEGGRVHVASKD